MDMLAQMSWPQWFLAAVLIGTCLLLMLVILLQRGRGGGLSGAFGGGGGSAAFGAKTGDVFTWITVAFTTLFVLLTVVANFAFDESVRPLAPAADGPAGGAEGADTGADPTQGIELEVTPTGDAEGGALPIKVTPVTPGNVPGLKPVLDQKGGDAGDGETAPSEPDGAETDPPSPDAGGADPDSDGEGSSG